MIRVANVRSGQTGVYIGRYNKRFKITQTASWLANPYHIGKDGTRAEVIAKYERWLTEKLQDRASMEYREFRRLLFLHKMHGELVLLCWCYPEPCHGDVIATKLLLAEGE